MPTAASTREPYPHIVETGPFAKEPNLGDYHRARTSFDWSDAERLLDRIGDDGWNIAHEAVDRHVSVHPDKTALRWLPRSGDPADITYASLAADTSRFASALEGLGLGPGTRVFVLSNRIPALHVAILGAIKHGSTVAPLFSAFGPEPIETRMALAEGKVLVTTDTLYRRKVEPIRERMPYLEHVIVVDTGRGGAPEGCLDFGEFLDTGRPDFAARRMQARRRGADSTSRRAPPGTPKGAIHTHRAVLHHHLSARSPSISIHDDVYWCTADPAGSPGPHTGSSPRSPTGSPASSTRASSTPIAGTEPSRTSGSRCGTPPPPRSGC
jgi:acetyl-CoA synthetase